MTRAWFIPGVMVALAACAALPKPQELLALEELRKGDRYTRAQKEQAALMAESEAAYKKAVELWEDKEIEESKHWAAIGSIKLRTATAIVAQEQSRQRIAAAQKQLKQVQAERADLELKISDTTEKIKLHEQLNAARKTAKDTETQLSAEQRVSKAQLALKMADTVEASKFAPEPYALAQAMLDKATAALKAKNASDASASAEIAQTKAEAAYQAARPLYLQAKQSTSRQVQNQALQRDAAAISGVTVRLQTVGQTQQLIIPVYSLFKRNSVTPIPAKLSLLNAIGDLVKKYPSYPVILNGYTSHLVRSSQRYAISLARAQQVANHFVTLGLPLKHFAISGLGSDNLFARKFSPINDRVEVVLLFQ
jgi:outer membrane protein OmpA-like peptidoglycan-associated protein